MFLLLHFFDIPFLTCRTEPSGAASSVIEIASPRCFRRDDLFDDQLANLTSGRQVDRFITSVIEQAAKLTPVIRIYHTGKHIQPILCSQPRSRRNTSVKPRRYRHCQSRPCRHSLPRPNTQILNRTNIQPRRQHTSPLWQHRTRIKLFEAKNVWCCRHLLYIFGSVTPRWPWYLPPRSLYEVSQTSSSSDSKKMTWATPSLA